MSDINIQTFSGKVSVKNDLRVGQGHLFVDTAANQVGLNSLTPQANLHVTGNTYVTSDLRVGSKVLIDSSAADSNVLVITGGGIKADFILGDGRSQWTTTGNDVYYTGGVAIGSSQTPTTALDVTGSGTFSGDLTAAFLHGDGSNISNITSSQWTTVNTNELYYALGNVGIGNQNPNYTLDVTGDINFTGNLTQNGSAYGGGGGGGGGVWTEITGTTTDIHYSSGNVGVANSSPQHTLSVGSNLYVEDAGSNVLVVDGNVACTQLTLGQFEIVPSYGLGDVTAESNVTTDTVELNNATTGLSTVANVVVGGELTVSGNAAVSSNLTVSGNAAVSSNLTVSGNATVSSNLTVTGNATVSSNLTVSGFVGTSETGAITVPTGTTVQQPTGVAGMVRFNSDLNRLEFWDSTRWVSIPQTDLASVSATGGTISTAYGYTIHTFSTVGNTDFVVTNGGNVEYLIVAGGGGAGSGGGGAGGVLMGSTTVADNTTYTITVGGGGVGGGGGAGGGGTPSNGGNSSALGLTAIGGGRGGGTGTPFRDGSNGGSGGGNGYDRTSAVTSGTVGQGHSGGNSRVTSLGGAGGGGGAGGPGSQGGADLQTYWGGSGGDGVPSDISGRTQFYGGGGGGGLNQNNNNIYIRPGGKAGGLGGLGGGGQGTIVGWTSGFTSQNGENGTNGLGGGGGGCDPELTTGGSGGSGVVIIRYK